MNERVKNKLNEACDTLTEFVERAKRRVNDERVKTDDMDAVVEVIHEFGWGISNALSSVEAALHQIQRDHYTEITELEKKIAACMKG